MNQLVILSGKGGAGKTSLTAAFAHLAETDPRIPSMVLADADVDASNLELVLGPHKLESEEFWGGQMAVIDQDACLGCDECEMVCRFDAIIAEGDSYRVDSIACDGCAACFYHCPNDAIRMRSQVVGEWYHSDSPFGPLFHANLQPAQENSGKLVSTVKQHARMLAEEEEYDLLLVDGPPGIGCPVISAVSGADLALVAAEPSLAGIHDMQRALDTTHHFGIQTLVCINKADIYPEGSAEIESFCREREIEILGTIPFDEMVIEAMTQGQPVTRYQPEAPASRALQEIWDRMVNHLLNMNN
ncbi:MAG: ATP-binding protein [Anaerolineales bacterium]